MTIIYQNSFWGEKKMTKATTKHSVVCKTLRIFGRTNSVLMFGMTQVAFEFKKSGEITIFRVEIGGEGNSSYAPKYCHRRFPNLKENH